MHRTKRVQPQGDYTMRLTSLAAGIFAVALTGYVGVTTVALAKGAGAQDSASTQALVSRDHSTDPSARAANDFRQPIEWSQSNQQQEPQGQGPLQVQTTIVNVFATARDKRHAIITDLTKDDFKILEDGVEQKVAFFSKEVNMPITLGLLIDTSASMDRMIEAEQDAASRFLREVMRPKDEAMVITFDFDVDLLADLTQDTSVLASAIHKPRVKLKPVGGGCVVTAGPFPEENNSGCTVLYDAIYLACHEELATEAGRKGLIILTDAEDSGSKMRLQDALGAAQRADAVIHVILISDRMATFGTEPGAAQRMAEDTGGRVIDVH